MMARGAYLLFTCLRPPIKLDQTARFRRCGSQTWSPPVVLSLAVRDRCKLEGAWEAWERKITSPGVEPALPKPPPDCCHFVWSETWATDHQGLSILINKELESMRGLKRGLPYYCTVHAAQDLAACRMDGSGGKERAASVARPHGFSGRKCC